MGPGYQVYAVDIAAVRKACGSKSRALAAKCATLADNPELASAVRCLIDGRDPGHSRDTAPLGHGLEILCEALGKQLDTGIWRYPVPIEYVAHLDTVLTAAGGPPATSYLWAGPPVRLPVHDQFPSIGHITAARAKQVAPHIAAALSVPPGTELRCDEDDSSKFWRGKLRGKTLTVTFGPIGSAGQTKPKTFASPAAARAAYHALAREKLANGYQRADPAVESRYVDYEVRASIGWLQSWFVTAVRRRVGLVFFYAHGAR